MRFRLCLNLAIAILVSLIGVQSASFAGAASRQGLISGHVRTFGSHHFRIPQPAPVQAVPTVNVRDFGATGNGVTDDTGAIQNAIAAAQASGKGVLFPAGTYLHNNIITANGVGLFGVGGASVLLAGSQTNTAVILTGVNPSIQNLVINTQFVSTVGLNSVDPNKPCLTVKDSQGFVVQGITILQGNAHTGVLLLQSAVGQVSGVAIFGGGGPVDAGILMDRCANVSLVGNSMSNLEIGITVGLVGGTVSQSIAIIGNALSAHSTGIVITSLNIVDCEQNQIQLSSPIANAIFVAATTNTYSITNNHVLNAGIGINVQTSGGGVVTQNVIQNCAMEGVVVATVLPGGGAQVIGNLFGECGLISGTPVIQVVPTGGPDSVVVLNNVYAGHANMLSHFIFCTGHVNVVSGNAQTQTVLDIVIP
ncbi:MAG: hypothetical protein C5B53_10595 [Candidatus Melainabacteria bacterium]|nr:MAG: hypothetical protein C5B53_10595 [Candidatus Melainabacteria bacterium]